jgi:hypothetical protein
MGSIRFFRATSPEERRVINTFLARHNCRGAGSTKGYVACYAAVECGPGGRPLPERIVAAAKFCPLHTPQAARFFGGDDWRHVYCLQRLAAHRAPENLLSQFLAWCLREMGKDPKVHFVATYADTGDVDPRTGRPHNGGVYRATNGATYCGRTQGGRVDAYILDGQRRSVRCGPRTLRVGDIPANARVLRSSPMHRYCWAVGPPLVRAFRRRDLERRMARFKFEPVYQPRLLARLVGWAFSSFQAANLAPHKNRCTLTAE